MCLCLSQEPYASGVADICFVCSDSSFAAGQWGMLQMQPIDLEVFCNR